MTQVKILPWKKKKMNTSRLWRCKGELAIMLSPFLLAGIVNVTPDSFYDGGRYLDPAQAVSRGLELARDGAGMLDLGGESTRPGSDPVPTATECERLAPVLRGLSDSGLDIPISIDTYRAQTAAFCLERGASVINDVSACAFDPDLPDVLVSYKPGYVLMHSQGRPKDMQQAPKYKDVVQDVYAFLEHRMGMLVRAGLPEDHIVIDPGIGFGKTLTHNLALLRGIETFFRLGRPVYIGLSNKSLWTHLLGVDLRDRKTATLTATVYLARKGVAIHRLHDIGPARQALRVLEALSSPLQG